MYTGILIPREDKFIPFKFFFTLRILLASLRLESLMIKFLFPLLGSQWWFSIFDESTVTSNFSKIISTFSSRSSFYILSAMPVNSRKSGLEYWLLLQHWHSMEIVLSLSLVLTDLNIAKSASSSSISFLSSPCLYQYCLESNSTYFDRLKTG